MGIVPGIDSRSSTGRASASPAEPSGGRAQCVAFARALIRRPDEAYSGLGSEAEFDMLRVLRLLPIVVIDELRSDVNGPDDLPIVGGMAARAGRVGAGHAALVAASHSTTVYTSLPHQIEAVLGKRWPVVEV